MPPLWHFDEPNLLTASSAAEPFRVSGWVAAFDPIDEIRIETLGDDGRPLLQLTEHERADVSPALGIPNLRAVGFRGECPRAQLAGHHVVELSFRCAGERRVTWAPVTNGSPHSLANKPRKLANLVPLLRCPECGASALSLSGEALGCSRCAAAYRYSAKHIDFLSETTRASYGLTDTENVSENAYEGEIVGIISRYHEGWVLDCGAGRRQNYYEHVVNFEVVPYETTDVLGVGERLPFGDGVFDAVLSVAVLEHVKDPFTCARELLRVLKPGGTLYCQLPFLQPYHGYPHHYFNGSSSGLRVLFEDGIDVNRLEVLEFGQPIAALSWILQRYVEGLPPEQQEAFHDMKVRDFLRPTAAQLGEPHVRALSEEARRTLACCNVLVGTKRDARVVTNGSG